MLLHCISAKIQSHAKNVDMQINGTLLIFPYIAYSLELHARERSITYTTSLQIAIAPCAG